MSLVEHKARGGGLQPLQSAPAPNRKGLKGSVIMPTEKEYMEQEKDAVISNWQTRCPKCGYVQSVDDQYELYEEGEHGIMCHECEHEYTVNTGIIIQIESPARLEAAL